uniref:Uncharacterized protein n=1 Tax=Pseudo-nitzschia australis TaxID=44445 RepID=A0A6U9WK67_9STRA
MYGTNTKNNVFNFLRSFLSNMQAFEIGCDILSILTSRQGFVDTVAEQGALWRLLWILERPGGSDDSSRDSQSKDDISKKQRGWNFLESLSSSTSIAPKILESSAWLELLGILVGYSEFTKIWIARIGAAKILSRLLWDPKTGQTLASLLGRFLPTSLIVVLKEEGPDTMLNLFDGESDTPELIWDGSMRGELRKVVGLELDSCIQFRRETGSGNEDFNLKRDVRVKFVKLENELFIGGVYVGRFLKEPTFNIRDPTSFLEALLLRWAHELQMCTDNESNGEEKSSTDIVIGDEDKLQPVTDAIVYLCKIRTNLCDKLAHWGYMSRCLTFLESMLARDLIGYPLLSVMRVLHVAANRRANVESLIASGANDRAHGIITFTIRATGDTNLHPDAGFILEMLKKIFADALGDLKKTAELKKSGIALQMASPVVGNHYAMAPSPAPGEGPVSRNRVRVSAGDDPLGLGAGIAPMPTPAVSQQIGTYRSTAQSYGQTYTGITNIPSQTRSQTPYNQTSNSQNYGMGFQQPQQVYNNQMMYESLQNSAGVQQTYHTQNQQIPQYQNSNQQHLSHHLQQQQPVAAVYSQRGTNVAQQTYGSQQNLQQQSIPASYPQPNTNLTQQAYTSQASNHRFTNIQQQNTTIPSSGTLQGQVLYSGYNVDSQSSNNMTHQAQFDSNNTNSRQSWQGSGQNTSISHGSQNLQSNQIPVPQGMFQRNVVQTSPLVMSTDTRSNVKPSVSTQVQSGQYHLSPGPKSSNKQVRTSQNSTYNTMLQQNNQVQTQGSDNDAVTQLYQQPPNAQQNQAHERYNQPSMLESNAPIVETVMDVDQQTQHGQPLGHHTNLSSNEGHSIDARTEAVSPSVKAAKAAETVQGAPNSADGRRALLESALRCDLPKYLIESILENPNLFKVKDPASVKVHVIELLKLLTQDPGYGLKFQLVLKNMPAWKKYVSQDHSLFITGHEQKTDYFLTDGTSSMASKRLLTDGK